MSPILALALLAAAGIAATRLRLPALPHPRSLDLVLATAGTQGGAALVLLGLVLGPGIELLDRPTLRALAPVTALGIGWIGAVLGARLEWRVLRRVPRRLWALAALQAGVVFVATGLAVWLLRRALPPLAAAWRPSLPTLLILAATAMVSGPAAVAQVARAVGVRSALARGLRRAAILDTALGALAFALALALYHPRQPFGAFPLAALEWLVVAAAASAGVGMLFLWLERLGPASPDEQGGGDVGLDLLGVMVFGAGVGYAADLSPFVVCALAAALIVNRSPQRRQVRALLDAWAPPIMALFLIVAGALLYLPTAWILPAVLGLGLVRVAARWAPVRYGRAWLRLGGLQPHLGLATVAQGGGGVAVALALSFTLIYGGPGTILTTVLLGVALAQAIAGPLMTLAVRPTPAEVTS